MSADAAASMPRFLLLLAAHPTGLLLPFPRGAAGKRRRPGAGADLAEQPDHGRKHQRSIGAPREDSWAKRHLGSRRSQTGSFAAVSWDVLDTTGDLLAEMPREPLLRPGACRPGGDNFRVAFL